MTKIDFLILCLSINGVINGSGDKLITAFFFGFTGGTKTGLYIAVIICIIIRIVSFFIGYKIITKHILPTA
jgi:hypothetical protein